MKIKYKDLYEIYECEIRKKVKNKEKILKFERYKTCFITKAMYELENNLYNGGRYNIFLVYRPKIRVVMSQNIYDKLINHYVARFILLPKLEHRLVDENCATRIGKGTLYALKLLKKKLEKYKKYENIYFLKLDISKYFYNIDHNVLLKNIQRFLLPEELLLLKNILNSTNAKYVNACINGLAKNNNIELPIYNYGKGLPIGNMTSQFLAIYYLSDLHYYLKHTLKLDFICYMDDYIFLSNDKEKLVKVLEIIKSKLSDEYKLKLNDKKTYIKNVKEKIPFLGYIFYLDKNKRTIIKLSQSGKKNIKKGIKRNKYKYENSFLSLNQTFCSIENYLHSYCLLKDNTITNMFNKYWY